MGRITASKGVAKLLSSFARWPNFGLTVIGDGELLPWLRREYASHGNITFLGSIPQKDLIEHYRTATALILLTCWILGCGEADRPVETTATTTGWVTTPFAVE